MPAPNNACAGKGCKAEFFVERFVSGQRSAKRPVIPLQLSDSVPLYGGNVNIRPLSAFGRRLCWQIVHNRATVMGQGCSVR